MDDIDPRHYLFDDDTVIATIDCRARADIAARRLIDHHVVRRWFDSWGKDRPLWPKS